MPGAGMAAIQSALYTRAGTIQRTQNVLPMPPAIGGTLFQPLAAMSVALHDERSWLASRVQLSTALKGTQLSTTEEPGRKARVGGNQPHSGMCGAFAHDTCHRLASRVLERARPLCTCGICTCHDVEEFTNIMVPSGRLHKRTVESRSKKISQTTGPPVQVNLDRTATR